MLLEYISRTYIYIYIYCWQFKIYPFVSQPHNIHTLYNSTSYNIFFIAYSVVRAFLLLSQWLSVVPRLAGSSGVTGVNIRVTTQPTIIFRFTRHDGLGIYLSKNQGLVIMAGLHSSGWLHFNTRHIRIIRLCKCTRHAYSIKYMRVYMIFFCFC